MSSLHSPFVHRPALAPRVFAWLGALALLSLLAGCDQLGIETPQRATERLRAEAKAVGSACRHALRAIEDCYVLNPKAEKSAVFEGWREMDEYMRENKLEGIAPVVPRPAPQAPKASVPKRAADDEEDEAVDKGDTASTSGKGTHGEATTPKGDKGKGGAGH